MIESRTRKAAFLREAARAAGLNDASVDESRIEDLASRYRTGAADLITIRGVRMDAMVFSLSAHLLRAAGKLLLFGAESGDIPTAMFRLADQEQLPGGSRLTVLERV